MPYTLNRLGPQLAHGPFAAEFIEYGPEVSSTTALGIPPGVEVGDYA